MPPFDSGDDLIWIAGRGEGDDDSVALVVVGDGVQTPLLHGPARLGTIQCGD